MADLKRIEPLITPSMKSRSVYRDRTIPFFDWLPEMQRTIYTTNAIKSVT